MRPAWGKVCKGEAQSTWHGGPWQRNVANERPPEAGHARKDAQSPGGRGLCWGLEQLPGRLTGTPAEPQGPLSPCSQ